MQIARKFTVLCRAATTACSLTLGIAVITAGSAAIATEQSSKRQWPSQLLPEQPINVRVCSCRYAGQNIAIGKTICMKFQGRSVMAHCGTVGNNPSWEISSKSCPSS